MINSITYSINNPQFQPTTHAPAVQGNPYTEIANQMLVPQNTNLNPQAKEVKLNTKFEVEIQNKINKGHQLFAMGNYMMACSIYSEVIVSFKGIDENTYIIAKLYNRIAKCYKALNFFRAASDLFSKIENIFKKLVSFKLSSSDRIKVYYSLGRLYAAGSIYGKAVSSFKLAMNESTHKIDSSLILAETVICLILENNIALHQNNQNKSTQCRIEIGKNLKMMAQLLDKREDDHDLVSIKDIQRAKYVSNELTRIQALNNEDFFAKARAILRTHIKNNTDNSDTSILGLLK